MKIVSAREMNAVEQEVMRSGTSENILIANAAKSISNIVKTRLGSVIGKNILVLAGPGNNGKDALASSLILAKWGANITVHIAGNDQSSNIFAESIQSSGNIVVSSQKIFLDFLDTIENSTEQYLLLDGLFGTGYQKRPQSIMSQLTSKLNKSTGKNNASIQVLAIDIPSGMNSDDGSGDEDILKADFTVAIGAIKKGLLTSQGLEKCGKIIVAPIGIPEESFPISSPEVLELSKVSKMLSLRPLDGHKGTFGKASIIGGSPTYIGAPFMAARSAIRSGAGLVSLVTPGNLGAETAEYLPEAIHESLPTNPSNKSFDQVSANAFLERDFNNATLIGPGIGLAKYTVEFVHQIIKSSGKKGTASRSKQIVIDADGITAISSLKEWWDQNNNISVITPHPGEMATLSNIPTESIQQNRLDTVYEKSLQWGVVVVLKGALTAVGNPYGDISVNPLAWPGLASAGTGDVLSGLITGLLAQGHEPYSAAQIGVYTHGISSILAAEHLAAEDRGILATDVADNIPKAINIMLSGKMEKYLVNQLTIVTESVYLS